MVSTAFEQIVGTGQMLYSLDIGLLDTHWPVQTAQQQ